MCPEWPKEVATRQMGQRRNLGAECPDWWLDCLEDIQGAFGTTKGMPPGTSGAQEVVKVKAGSGVWGVTSISVITDPR